MCSCAKKFSNIFFCGDHLNELQFFFVNLLPRNKSFEKFLESQNFWNPQCRIFLVFSLHIFFCFIKHNKKDGKLKTCFLKSTHDTLSNFWLLRWWILNPQGEKWKLEQHKKHNKKKEIQFFNIKKKLLLLKKVIFSSFLFVL